jgi:hypothetical protein
MKKAILLLTITATSIAGYAQNGLGVGNTNPQEMLDVSGAIRIGNGVISTPANAGTIRWNTTATQFEGWDGGQWVVFGGGGGTVTTVSVTTANGVSGTVANPTTTPAISVQLGAITPTSVAATGTVEGSNLSGTNTGDQTAAEVDVTPASGVAATDVQAALEELQGEIDAIAPTIEDVLTNGDVAADGQSLKIDQVRAIDADGLLLTDDADNGIFIEDGGNVGIGALDPTFLLDVSGVGLNQGGVTTSDNVLARFEQTTNAAAGIQIKGFRNLANGSSFIDFMNETSDGGGSVYTLGRVEGVNIDAGSQGALAFYTNNGTALTERMRINAAGTVQLNTYTTNGIVRTTSGNGTLSTVGGGVNLASEVTGVLPIANGGTGSATQNFVDLTTAQTAAGVKTWSNNAFFNGNVSIGTTNTSYKLDVDGNGHFNTGLRVDGVIGTDVCPGGCTFSKYTIIGPDAGQTGFRDMGLWVSEGVRAREFYTESDERIKDVIGISNAKNDLDKIMAIEITEYTFIDKSKGHSTMKKVIAQQVEKVYPEAVAKSISIVPDIYQLSTINGGFIPLVTNVVKGDNVKLIYDDNAVVLAEVTSVVEDGFYVNQDRTGQVFIYGREVNDFRIVDYDALAMLNISATQALFKLITELQTSNSELKSELKSYASLQSDVEKIKGVLGLDLQTSK